MQAIKSSVSQIQLSVRQLDAIHKELAERVSALIDIAEDMPDGETRYNMIDGLCYVQSFLGEI